MAMTKEQIFAAAPKNLASLPKEEVEAWGGTVWVRAMSGIERDRFEVETGSIRECGDNPLLGIRARIVAWCACDESGKRLFEAADVKTLETVDAGTLDRLFAVASRLSGFSPADVKELEKNSKGTNGESSPAS